MRRKGLFIVIEGIDGSGKSTQIENLKAYFHEKGLDVVVTREPGGTRIGEKIRGIVLDPENQEMDSLTEMFLYAASRAQHVAELVQKSLDDGVHVICDRFVLSSYVYQGIARGIDLEIVKKVNAVAMQGLVPDITFFINIDDDEAFRRRAKRMSSDRIENEDKAFHLKVFKGYRELAKDMENVVWIDGMKSVENVTVDMTGHIDGKI
ncbi:MAG TPA: dTMP kinase [Clostridiales bacterium]|nr:dTMP kinase [Clostridiales bacterium]